MITYTACTTFDSGYVRTGELPPNTRYVQIQIEDRAPFGHYLRSEAEEIIENAFRDCHTRYKTYKIIPAAPGTKMSEETKSKLRQKKEAINEVE